MEEDQDHIRIPVIDKREQIIKESALFAKYAAISQDESFIVIFDNHSKSLTFVENQKVLMESDDFSSWSIAVSNEHQERFRLIAISCISQGDMQDLPGSEKYSSCGFTQIWMIRNDFDIKECNIKIENGGIIQFLSEDDEFTLIMLKGNGIYKYRLSYLSVYTRFQHEILVLNYPERIINALKYNCSDSIMNHKTVPPSDVIHEYLLRCLSSHYLLVDTSDNDSNKNIELYNLKTNQLMNIFKRYKFVLSILDRENPGSFTISSDEKLLAYVSGNGIKIYLIENGLELSSLSCKKSGLYDVEFMKFVFNNEKLLIFKGDRTAAVWDIFNSVREFIEFIPLEKATSSGLVKHMTRIVIGPMLENESFKVLNIRPSFDDDQIVWDRLVLNEHLKRSGFDSDWKELNPSECIITDSLPYAPYAYGINENDKQLLTDLNDSDLKYYLGIEPWAIHPAERILDTYVKPRLQFPRYVIYLDVEKQARLLIGNNSVQVWRGKKLEFIRIVNYEPDAPEEPYEKFKVNKIRYGIQKFDLSINLEGKTIQIKIEHENDIIQIVKNAIKALKYLDSQNKSVNITISDKLTKFKEIVQQTRNIIIRFITLYPNLWRLIDFRCKLMTEFINIRDFSLITHILFNKENASANDSEKSKLKNTISKYSSKTLNKNEKERPLHSWQVPLKEILLDIGSNIDATMLILFLEYYSNNAMDNIGWMNVVSEIIPELYERKYGLDMSSFKFYEIKKHSEDFLKVFIPITQLIPRDANLNLINISDNEIPYIRMVPLTDFTTNKENQSTPSNFKKIITKLFLPRKFSSTKNEDYSPFIRIIKLAKKDDPFYENPSMEATTNMMWHFSKDYWHRILYNFVIYFLAYSIFSWAYIVRLEIYGVAKCLYMINHVMISIKSFLIVFALSIIGMGHALATFYWDSTQFNFWNFWPLIIIFGFLIVIILEVIIMGSFIGVELSNAEKNSKHSVLQIQNAFIYNYACLEDSSLTWNEKSVELDSERLIRLEKKYELDLNEEYDIDINDDIQFFCA
ncbi:6704_t:CDS:2 [Dentiscutata erythropus]|uniref:6704_t:CDS:1 n=1 Tax=Dentiscutata erythropus TaxID=1348616 RepID=A0A9N9NF83_9GLOM|nr:6704_t:CDS:2 [Dentiscutata erythropus]